MLRIWVAPLAVAAGLGLVAVGCGGGAGGQQVVGPPASSVVAPPPASSGAEEPPPAVPAVRIVSPSDGATVEQYDEIVLEVSGDLLAAVFILDATGLNGTNWWRQPVAGNGARRVCHAQYGEAGDVGRGFRVVSLLLPAAAGAALPAVGVPGALPTGAVASASLTVTRR